MNVHEFRLWEEATDLEGAHRDTGRTCELHTEGARLGTDTWGPSCCEATQLTTTT